MQEILCPFGPAFLKARLEHGQSQWAISLRLAYHIRSIQRIEKGERQPGVMLALRLVAATGSQIGDFFQELTANTPEIAYSMSETDIQAVVAPPPSETLVGVKCYFGPFFRQLRLATGISQACIATTVGYNLRNMNGIESGKQEPGVMTALRMVSAAKGEVRAFFNTLHEGVGGSKGRS